MQEDTTNLETNENSENQNNTSKEVISESKKKCNINKTNILIISNVICLLCIAAIFIFLFQKKSGPTINPEIFKKANSKTRIVFLNSDTLMLNYELVKNLRSKLETKQHQVESEFAGKQKTFEKEVTEYQQKVQSNSISMEQAQITEKQLMEKQQMLKELNDKFSEQLVEQESAMNLIIHDSLTNFLKRYNQIYHFDYILGYSKGGGILLANDTLDITSDIIKELNREYKLKNKE